MPNIYDYIKTPGRAIRDGYSPCYLTRVSTMVWAVTSNASEINYGYLNFGLDKSLRDNLESVLLLIVALLITLTIPISCWFLAFLLPKGGE